jgi:hypothetical protein
VSAVLRVLCFLRGDGFFCQLGCADAVVVALVLSLLHRYRIIAVVFAWHGLQELCYSSSMYRAWC